MKLVRILLALAILSVPTVAFAATGTAAPYVKPQWFDANGDPCAGCLLFTYSSGTSTKANTYTDYTLGSANTNPIVLDAAGRANVFLTPGVSYKFVLSPSNDTDPPTSPVWTVDGLAAVPPSVVDVDITATAGEGLSAGEVVYLSAGDGARTAGRWYKADSDLDYGSISANALGITTAAITSGSTGTIRIAGRMTGLSSLTVGSVYYIDATAGTLTSTPPTNSRKIGIADTTSTLIMSHSLIQENATATRAGIMTTAAQVLAGVKDFNDHPRFEPGTSTGTYANVSGRVTTNTTQVGNVGAGEDDLMTYTVPANVLDTDGKALRITVWGLFAVNGNAKTIRYYYGGTAFTAYPLADTAANGFGWSANIYIVRTGAAAQRHLTQFITSSGGVQTFSINSTGTKDNTAAQAFKITGEGTATDDVVQFGMIVEVVG
jgi:hypothetical protein